MTIPVSPASSWSGFITGMATIVVQFGLATIPLRISRNAAALTSGTTSGTSGSMRQAEVLSTTTAPAAASRGASSLDALAPVEQRAMSSPTQVSRRRVLDLDLAVGPRQPRPGRSSRGEEPDVVGREGALDEDRSDDAADLPGGAEDP